MGMLDSAATVLSSDPTKKTVAVKSRLPSLPPRSLCFLVSAWRNICPKEKNNLFFVHCVYLFVFQDSFCNVAYVFFSSPEPKAQVSYSDQNCLLSVVFVVIVVAVFVVINFLHFHVLLHNHWTNFNQNILRWRGFKFVHIKNHSILLK